MGSTTQRRKPRPHADAIGVLRKVRAERAKWARKTPTEPGRKVIERRIAKLDAAILALREHGAGCVLVPLEKVRALELAVDRWRHGTLPHVVTGNALADAARALLDDLEKAR